MFRGNPPSSSCEEERSTRGITPVWNCSQRRVHSISIRNESKRCSSPSTPTYRRRYALPTDEHGSYRRSRLRPCSSLRTKENCAVHLAICAYVQEEIRRVGLRVHSPFVEASIGRTTSYARKERNSIYLGTCTQISRVNHNLCFSRGALKVCNTITGDHSK